MKRFLSTIDSISKWAGEFARYISIALLVVVFVGVIARYGFNTPLKWSSELAQFLFGSLLLAGAVTLQMKGHIRVTLLEERLPPKPRGILELVGTVFLWLFCGMLLYQGGIMAWTSIRVWETSATFWDPPIWPIKIVIPLSALLMVLQGVAKFIRDWRTLSGKRLE